jgi:hypothetical protein
MKDDIFNRAIQKALIGSRKLKIKFSREAVGDVMCLCGMERGGIVKIDDATALTLSAVMQSGKWGSDSNRIVTIQLGDHFDPKLFGGRMERALEKIEAID